MKIRRVKNKLIDKSWWDSQIDECTNHLIYAKSWYLDAVCPGWEAVIFGDDEAFMPIPTKYYLGVLKLGLQPLLSQQLGIFYKQEQPRKEDLDKALKGYLKYQLNFNAGNSYSGEKKVNYILPLNKAYDVLRLNYKKDAKKNLKKDLEIDWLEPPFNVAKFNLLVKTYRSQYGKLEGFDEKKEGLLKKLLLAAQKNKALQYYEIQDFSENVLFAGVLLKDAGRLHYLFAAPTHLGREKSITHYFIDGIVRKYAGKNCVLDFEGSMIPTVAKFYQKWGSIEEQYAVISKGFFS